MKEMRTCRADLITVIVAVYNIEDYVAKCIESVINQTYRTIEILVIDDGSTDKSGGICDAYAERDNRIKVFHGKNRGLSEARNQGIGYAKGDYLVFVDGDDWIHPQMIEMLYDVLKKNGSDIAACGFERKNIRFAEQKYRSSQLSVRNITREEAVSDMYSANVVAWNKLYKRSIFDDIRYPAGRIHEDEFTAHRIYWKCNRISVISEPMYFYVMREDSIVNTVTLKSIFDGLDALLDRLSFAKEHNWTEVLDSVAGRCLDYMAEWYYKLKKSKDKKTAARIRNRARMLIKQNRDIKIKYQYHIFAAAPVLYASYRYLIKTYGKLIKRLKEAAEFAE